MVWNKGYTKQTHPSLLKTSRTMKSGQIDNFKTWREKMKKEGIIPLEYPEFTKNQDLAEFIGVILGDGNISQFPRTQRLLIFSNSNNPGFANRYAMLTEKIFGKSPYVKKVSTANLIRISIYQKNISERLGIPCGNKSNFIYNTPAWIVGNNTYLVSLLRGLFEAEGSLSIHKPTYTYNFQFSNKNASLLSIVAKSLEYLGFHPEKRSNSVRLRRKNEVGEFKRMIKFREY